MCFSAPASFAASAVLGGLGVGALYKTRHKPFRLLAFVPIIFAIQQMVEGFLWLSIGHFSDASLVLTLIFCFFALFWWPAYMPWVVYACEDSAKRKKIIRLLGIGGGLLGIFLYTRFWLHPLPARVYQSCLVYDFPIYYSQLFALAYGIFALGPLLISSRAFLKLFGLLVAGFALITWYKYTVSFISVWCFFAAVLSALIFFYVSGRANRSFNEHDKPQ